MEQRERPRRHRAVMNDARRKIERSLMVTDAADELATAVERLLQAAEGDDQRLAELRAALKRYRAFSPRPSTPG
ncbi:MAG TPA: hypothetical protein VJT78_05250 [Candidatus Dormibacteraeota bacterium]|nr:hypothetical protein [Candidatus Dormibacteraeota bacterium]